MAIRFLSARYIKRRDGHSVINRLAYVARQRLVEARTGETFDYRERKDLLAGPTTLLPDLAADALADGYELWTAVDAVQRADAVLGIDLIASLPTELDLALAEDLLRNFLTDTICAHGLGVTYAIHRSHDGMTVEELSEDMFSSGDPFDEAMAAGILNVHGHVLVTPRQVGPGGVAKRRHTILDPVIQRGKTVDGLNWGRLWAFYQNSYFARAGLTLRVRPRAPVASNRLDLKDVRRWRKRQEQRNLNPGGRDRLVDPGAEERNADLLRSIGEGLTHLDRPFTREELLDLYQRYLGAEEAQELADAALGLGDVVQLGRFGSRWSATKASIATELTIFGRAAALASHVSESRIIADLHHGLSEAERGLLRAIAGAPDLVLIEAFERPEIAIENLARLAVATGRVAISIGHGAASRHPKAAKAVLRDVSSLQGLRISNGIVIVDQADALAPRDLDLLIQAALAGQCQLVLVRRPAGIWPESALVDLATSYAFRVEWGRTRSPHSAAELFGQGKVGLALDHLEQDHRVSRVVGREGADSAVLTMATDAAFSGRLVVVLVDSDERRASIEATLAAKGVKGEVTNRLPMATPAPVIAILDPHHHRGPMVAAQLARAAEIYLIVDTNLIPTRADLIDLLTLEMPLGVATRSHVAAWWRDELTKSSPPADGPLPRFAVDFDGDVLTDPRGIEAMIQFWASVPFDLSWSGDYMLSADAIASAIGKTTPRPSSFPPAVDIDGSVFQPVASASDETYLDHELPAEPGDDRDDDFGNADTLEESDLSDEWDDFSPDDDDPSDDPEREI